jgi:hypothetical protein
MKNTKLVFTALALSVAGAGAFANKMMVRDAFFVQTINNDPNPPTITCVAAKVADGCTDTSGSAAQRCSITSDSSKPAFRDKISTSSCDVALYNNPIIP